MEFRAHKIEGGFVDGLGEFREYPKDFQEEEEVEDGSLENCFSYDDYKVTDVNSDDMNVDSENNEQSSDADVDVDVDVDAGVDVDIDVERECKHTRGRYRQYSEKQRDEFWHLVIEEGCPTYRAAKELGIKLQTAYTWVQKENRRLWNKYHGIEEEKPKKRGRKPLLNDEHKEFLEKTINDNPTIVLEDMLEKLKEQFGDLKASIATIHRFVRKVCHFSLKRISKWPISRNTPENLKKRYEWALEYKVT